MITPERYSEAPRPTSNNMYSASITILKHLHLAFVQGNLIHSIFTKSRKTSWETSTFTTGISFASYH